MFKRVLSILLVCMLMLSGCVHAKEEKDVDIDDIIDNLSDEDIDKILEKYGSDSKKEDSNKDSKTQSGDEIINGINDFFSGLSGKKDPDGGDGSAAGTTEDSGATTQAATPTPTATTVTDTTQAAAADPVKIIVYRPTFNLIKPDEAQVKKVEDAINEYIKDRINVTVEIHDISSGDYVNYANLALADKAVNLLWTASWESTIGVKDLVYSGAVYDLTDLLPGTTLYNSMEVGQWQASSYNGRNYFVPVYKDNAEGYDLMFRQALVDKYGWNTSKIKSLADLENILADAKAAGIKYPLLLQKRALFNKFYIDRFDFFTGYDRSGFVAVDRSTDSVVDTVLTPEYLEYCTLIAKWAEAGYIDAGEDVLKDDYDYSLQSKNWAVSWWLDIPDNDEADLRCGQDVTVQPITDRWINSNTTLASCYCVSSSSTGEQAMACIDFLGLLYTDNYLADLYTYGIEGEDFTYNGNGQVVPNGEKYYHSMWESTSATIVSPVLGEAINRSDLYKAY
ncbi:MAG: hypothetical protein J5728_04640, partial [Lachnospiraceae bacterium]|nr:hypothetical protein [Lachnospiraceae bacterium]